MKEAKVRQRQNMIFERIVSPGLAHYSYIIGDKNEAAVVDPRRDCQTYIDKANAEGIRIAHVLETHRNEDYLIGSMELAHRTNVEIWHADSQWDYRYGKGVKDGQRWNIGRLEIQAMHTPGHTPGIMSYLLYDPSGIPWVLFSGDTLFAGEVGRIDLMGEEKAPEMAGLLYDSLFGKVLPLGDEILLCPAHGAGSVCGESIAERLWTTIGLERKNNPRLQYKDKKEFVDALLKSQPERPPYFSMMEKLNLEGPVLGVLPSPVPLTPKDFEAMAKNAQVVDTRMELGFGAAHVPDALSIWMGGLASFAGWFLIYDKPILLVNETNDPEEVTRILIRLGFDNIQGYLGEGMLNWHMSGIESESVRTINVSEACRLLDVGEPIWILDVRSDRELKKDGRIPGAQHIHITQIPKHLQEIPQDKTIHIFCGSGMRSMIAASLLQRNGWKDLVVILGGMEGWKSIKCPVKR